MKGAPRLAAASQDTRARYAQRRESARRGQNRIHRCTHDIDSEEANIHAPLGEDRTLEGSNMVREAILETVEQVRRGSIDLELYSQGGITRVARDALVTLLNPKQGYDHWSGTNDLSGSQLAKNGGFSERHWYRVKPWLARLGFLTVVHRSIATGLEKAPGVDSHLQISDLYHFSPANMLAPIREIFDAILTRRKAAAAAKAREGKPRTRTPLVKRDKPKCRIPAQLNPAGWACCLAALAKARAAPTKSYAEQEAAAVAFATAQFAAGWGKG